MGVIDFALLIRSAFLPIAAFFLDYGLAVTRHAFKQALLVHRRVYKTEYATAAWDPAGLDQLHGMYI